MNDSRVERLQRELLQGRGAGPAWGNRPGGPPYVEPTALATLALAASDSADRNDPAPVAVRAAADWLASLQQRDGATGIGPDLPQPRWTTPLSILVWSAIDPVPPARERAVRWLLQSRGNTWVPEAAEPFGHDPRIAGWPWVEGTHSWLEPTAMAVLALRRAGCADHGRTRDGLRLIRDRVIRTGGWNYGNSTVFGADLRPQPAPTGMALLALAGLDDRDSPLISLSCDYLDAVLPTTRAPQSLCFGILALEAWGRRPAAADSWLDAAGASAALRSDSIPQIAYLLLAFASRALPLFGISRPAATEGDNS